VPHGRDVRIEIRIVGFAAEVFRIVRLVDEIAGHFFGIVGIEDVRGVRDEPDPKVLISAES